MKFLVKDLKIYNGIKPYIAEVNSINDLMELCKKYEEHGCIVQFKGIVSKEWGNSECEIWDIPRELSKEHIDGEITIYNDYAE